MSELEQYDPEHVFIIGGESIYKKFYKYCDKCFVTKMHAGLHDKFMVNPMRMTILKRRGRVRCIVRMV